jgi:hypothetical protein
MRQIQVRDGSSFSAVAGYRLGNGGGCSYRNGLMVEPPTQPTETDLYFGTSYVYNIRFEVFTAVTIKNVVLWDIKTHFVLHRRHITSPLHSPAG